MNNKKVIADSPSPKIENKPVKKLSGSFHVDENATKKKTGSNTTHGNTFSTKKQLEKSVPRPKEDLETLRDKIVREVENRIANYYFEAYCKGNQLLPKENHRLFIMFKSGTPLREVCRCSSFTDTLKRITNEVFGVPLVSSSLEYVYEKIYANCLSGSPIIPIQRFTRVANLILYNPASKDGKIIEISSKAIKCCYGKYVKPVLNIDYKDTSNYVPTDSSELLGLLGKITNLSRENNILLAVFLLAVFAEIQTPILCITGTPGSGKTVLMKRLVDLIDPRNFSSHAYTFPSNDKDLSIILSRNQISAFDNLDDIPSKKFNSILCQSVTGASMEVRKLYTDNDIVSLNLRCPILLSSIGFPITAPDLLSRSLEIRVPEAGKRNYITTKELEETANQYAPKILGAMFDALRKYLSAAKETNTIECKTRLCDFYEFGVFVSPFLGVTGSDFSNAYYENQRENILTSANCSPVINAIQVLLNEHSGYFAMSAQNLRDEIIRISGLKSYDDCIPKNPTQMSACISNNDSILNELGIEYGRSHGKTRLIWFKKKDCVPPSDNTSKEEPLNVPDCKVPNCNSADSSDSAILCDLEDM